MDKWTGKGSKKEAHSAVDYRTGTSERRCAVCTMYVAPKAEEGPHCTSVVDPIRGRGLCDLFKRRGAR